MGSSTCARRAYRLMPTLTEYLLIADHEARVELHRRGEPWAYFEASGMESTIELASIGYTLRLRDLYQGIVPETEASA